MKIERFTYRLAFVWLCFRMLADIIGKTIAGLLNLCERMLEMVAHIARLAIIAGILWWTWRVVGPLLP